MPEENKDDENKNSQTPEGQAGDQPKDGDSVEVEKTPEAQADYDAAAENQSNTAPVTPYTPSSPDPLNGLNEDQSKTKENTQNGDPRAYPWQDQRAVNPNRPGATNPDEVLDHAAPAGAESANSGDNFLAGPPGDRDPNVEEKIQKGQYRHTSEGNPRKRINPDDSQRHRKVT